MQSRNFRLQKVGNSDWLEKNYKFQEIAYSLDELILLDATREKKNIFNFCEVLKKIVGSVFIPIAAGGGINSLEDADLLFKNGADKLVLNSNIYNNVSLVNELAYKYGNQSIVASVDYKKINNENIVFINDGSKSLDISLNEYVSYLSTLNIGEIYLNSMDKDGTGFGFDFETIDAVSKNIKIPLIIAGGAGNESHLIEGLRRDKVNAVATANLFNFMGNGLPNARKKIITEGLNIANWYADSWYFKKNKV